MDDSTLVKMLLEGRTLQEVADHFKVSKQRVHQKRKRLLKDCDRTAFGSSLKRINRRKEQIAQWRKKYNRDQAGYTSDLDEAQSNAFVRKKQNVKRTGRLWDIDKSDLVWPSHCPVLGIELDWFAEKMQDNSPSFDRVDSSKGYVKGNVKIISLRANRIKNNGTAEEHIKIAEYINSAKVP